MLIRSFRNRSLLALLLLLAGMAVFACKSKKPLSFKKRPTADPCVQQRDSLLKELAKVKEADPSTQMRSLMDSIKAALPGLDDDDLKIEIRKGKLYVSLSDKLLFKSGSVTVE